MKWYRTLLHSHWIKMVSPSFPLSLTLFLFFFVNNPFLMNIQKWPKSPQVAVFIFLWSVARVQPCFLCCCLCNNEHLIGYVHVCVCTHTYTQLYMYNIYTIYMWTYIGSVYTFIHNIVYIVSTGDKLNWVQTLAHVSLFLAPSVCFKQSGAFLNF